MTNNITSTTTSTSSTTTDNDTNVNELLKQAEQVITKRFLLVYQEKINSVLGDRSHFHQQLSPPLKLQVNWQSVKELISQHGLTVAENAIQILQENALYENMKKGIMRYISEDKLQRNIFNDQVDVICIEFFAGKDKEKKKKSSEDEEEDETGEETIVGLSDEQEGLLLYCINAKTQEILGSNAFYEQIDESFEELLEEVQEQQVDTSTVSTTMTNNNNNSNNSISSSGKEVNTAGTNSKPTSPNNSPRKVNTTVSFSDKNVDIQSEGSDDEENDESSNGSSSGSKSTSTSTSSINVSSPSIETLKNNNNNMSASFIRNNRKLSYVYNTGHLVDNDLSSAAASSSMNDQEDISTGDKVKDLRKCALQPMIWEKKDLTKLLKLIQNDRYWKPNQEQEVMIEKCKGEIKIVKGEKIIKSWIITKLNRKSCKQERVFILTDRKFYTIKINGDKIDEKHLKSYPLDAVIMLDCARFLPNRDKKKKPYGLAIYMSSDKVSSGTPVTPTFEDEEETDNKDKKVKKKLTQKVMGKLKKQKSLNTKDSDDEEEEKIKKAIDLDDITPEEKNQQRPDTSNLVAQYFMACTTVHQSDDQREFLLEVAWVLFAVISCLKGQKQLVPFTQHPIKRPKKDLVGTFLYNKLNIGLKK
ncbi:hypothetical protein ABK040_003335 [Willaertia magna]